MASVNGVLGGALAALIGCVACTGTIDGGEGGTGGPNGTGANGTGANGTGANGTGANGTGGQGTGGAGSSTPNGPGFVTARRLNHSEYNNTVRDLLGTSLRPADEFPPDDLGGEFDTVGSALSLSPAYVMAYEKAAHDLATDLFAADAARRQRVLTCDVAAGGDACAQTILQGFARRAWRRPVTAEEVQSLMLPVTTARQLGATATDGLRHAIAAVLLSPFFVFKLEIDPDPASTAPRRLGPHELATRLSYAIWSSMPDDALFSAADSAQLETDEQVGAAIDRMLADARSEALLDTFAARWLEYDHLESHEVEAALFPRYSPALAQSMQREARRFVQEFLQTPTPVSDMLSARFTFVDSALATHYGLPAPGGAAGELTRVDTSAAPRGGILTLGAFLTVSSFASRTSAVKRGEFVFNRLLCETVPPPPPDVPSLPTEATQGLSLRQRLEQHRADPACSSCHSVMDPIGFGLENYDAIGAYRTEDAGLAIDASGALPDGRAFNGALELGSVLTNDPRFARCVTQKFMTFALGRLILSTQPNDVAWVNFLANQAQAGDKSLKSVIRTVLLSEHFRSRLPAQPL